MNARMKLLKLSLPLSPPGTFNFAISADIGWRADNETNNQPRRK